MRIDPWSSELVDYKRLTDEFGIQKMKNWCDDNHLFRRGIIFGHRDFDKFLADLKAKKPTSILTGIMPSGEMHIGHKTVVDQCIYWQNKGVKTRVLIADIEAMTTRNITEENARALATNSYLINWVALGMDLKKSSVYAQSHYTPEYYKLSTMLSGRMTMAELKAIYGDLTPGKLISAFLQAGDILHPQLDSFDGKHRVLVPVGVDQDPHLRFIRGLADKINFTKPSSTYNMFVRGLDGGKMSSSKPSSFIGMNEPVQSALKKVGNILTGGRDTAEEQRKKGGQPEKCPVYELYIYHFMPDDKELEKIFNDCKSGKMLCGECKKILKEKVEKFLTGLEKKRAKSKSKVEKFASELF